MTRATAPSPRPAVAEAPATPAVGERAPGTSAGAWLGIALAVGAALRIWEAAASSLWLDELHTLSHASQPDLSALLEAVARDWHKPFFFGAVHLAGGWEQGALLRWIPIVASLALLPLVASLARTSSAGPRVAALSLWLLACLPYQVHYGAELRPYAWIALFSASAAWAAFSRDGSRGLRFAVFLVSVLLGFQTHRLMAIVVFSLGAARLVVRDRRMLGLGWLILAGTIGVAPEVAWLRDFAAEREEERTEYTETVHGGETQIRAALVKETVALPLRLQVPVMGFLGGAWAQLSRLGAVLLFGATVLGLAAWVAGRVQGRAPPLSAPIRGLAVFAAMTFAITTVVSLYSWDRVPLQYYAGMAWVLPILVAELACSPTSARLRRAIVATVALGALIGGVALAGGKSREDMRAAVEQVHAWRAELVAADPRPEATPIVTAMLAQPGNTFENLLPYRAYAPDLPAVEPAEVPRPGEEGFERPVLVLRRVLDLEHPKWQPIRAGRDVLRSVQIDRYVTVYEFRPGP